MVDHGQREHVPSKDVQKGRKGGMCKSHGSDLKLCSTDKCT